MASGDGYQRGRMFYLLSDGSMEIGRGYNPRFPKKLSPIPQRKYYHKSESGITSKVELRNCVAIEERVDYLHDKYPRKLSPLVQHREQFHSTSEFPNSVAGSHKRAAGSD